MPRAGLAGGGAQNDDDTRIPEEDGYIFDFARGRMMLALGNPARTPVVPPGRRSEALPDDYRRDRQVAGRSAAQQMPENRTEAADGNQHLHRAQVGEEHWCLAARGGDRVQ